MTRGSCLWRRCLVGPSLLLGLMVVSGFVIANTPAEWNQLESVELDPERTLQIDDLLIHQQLGELRLKNGILAFQRSPNPHIAVFRGDGVLRWEPPNRIEAQQLARFAKESPLTVSFDEMVMWFSSDLWGQLHEVQKAAVGLGPIPSDFLRKRTEFWLKMGVDFRLRLYETLSNSADRGVLVAELKTRKRGRLLFVLDHNQPEEMQLGRVLKHGDWMHDVWNRFSLSAGLPGTTPKAKRTIRVLHHDIDLKIEKNQYLSGRDTLEFEVLEDGVEVIPFELTKKLRVRRVADNQGHELQFIQPALIDPRKDTGRSVSSSASTDQCLVRMTKPLGRGDRLSLQFDFEEEQEEGKIIDSAGTGVFFVGNRWSWHPDYGDFCDKRATYLLRFTYPARYDLVAVGEKLEGVQEEDWKIARWEMKSPVAVAGFNYGDFESAQVDLNGRTIAVHANRNPDDMLAGLQRYSNLPGARPAGLPPGLSNIKPTRLAEQVANEVASAVELFEHYFGPYPYSQLIVSQITGSFGQGWPSLLYVSGLTFLDSTQRHFLGMQRQSEQFFGEELGAHEASHQWWGHKVGWSSYRDQWLSEGFATYSGYMYLATKFGTDQLMTSLKRGRDRLFMKSKEGPRYTDLGPIWMGTRLSSAKDPRSYSVLVYQKGAYVLHMLRCMMTDFSKWDDSRFRAMMQDFVKTYSGRSASTADFKGIVDKHVGEDMGWFFDQWVYGTEVPSYKGDWDVTSEGGRYRLTVKVEQKGVSDSFKAVLPIKIEFDEGYAVGRIPVTGARAESSLVLPRKPTDVEFNFFSGVLAR